MSVFFCNVIIVSLYLYVCVEGRLARTGWNIRQRPKTVILLIKSQIQSLQSPPPPSPLFSLSLCLSVCLSLSLSVCLSVSLSLALYYLYINFKRLPTCLAEHQTSKINKSLVCFSFLVFTCLCFSPTPCCCFFVIFISCFVYVIPVIIDPYEYHMDLCNESCSFGRSAIWLPYGAKTLMLNITSKLFNQIFSYLPC